MEKKAKSELIGTVKEAAVALWIIAVYVFYVTIFG
jgi:hypothetical protein